MKLRDALKLIDDDGWFQVAQEGSHRQFKHPVKIVRVTRRSNIPGNPYDCNTLEDIYTSMRLQLQRKGALP
jgi:predicted RNA binding protein YcfA (HicA-like mRNA interferase family)